VQTEETPVDQGSNWQVVKQLSELLSDIDIAVFVKNLVVETINMADVPRLVIASQ